MASATLGDKVGLAVIGCGGFGLFALQHFAQAGGVKLVGMAGTHRPAALAAARRNGRLLVANLMQRYNPLFDAVRQLVRSRVLGDFLHGTFENYASDENLPADHWFWDRPKSGGIFVEHGVHFFDLFDGWLGTGRVEAAQCGVRPVFPAGKGRSPSGRGLPENQ